MQLKVHHYFYLLVSFLFLGIIGFNLFSDGMFMDGLIYAAVSENMANGSGTFWSPHLSDSLMSNFHEHPPLAFGLQSIWFSIFGSSFLVERFYSLFTWLLIGYIIILIWEQIVGDKKTGWIPLLLITTVEALTWSASNNMLENTMTVFVCIALYAYLKYSSENKSYWIVIAGLAISLGFLTKGFFCLYLWSLPFFVWAFGYRSNFKKMLKESLIIVGSTILPIVLLYFLIPGAKINLTEYVNHQVLGSIESVKTVDSRFAILGEFIRNMAIPVGICMVILIVARKKKWSKIALKSDKQKLIWVLISLTLSGIIPIMISLKQRGFYIVTVYPIIIIALSLYILPHIKESIKKIEFSNSKFKIFKGLTIAVIFVSISICVSSIFKIGRDHDIINDLNLVKSNTPNNITIDICPEMRAHWNLHGYYSRYADITLDFDPNTRNQYYLTNRNCTPKDTDEYKYFLLDLETKSYDLYIVIWTLGK